MPWKLALAGLAAGLPLAAGGASWTGESGGFQVTIDAADVRAVQGGRTVFSLAARFEARLPTLEKDAREWAGDMAERDIDHPMTEVQVMESYEALSLVGPYLSLRASHGSDWPGAAHPSAFSSFESIDLRAPARPASLDQLFPEAQLRAALLADSVVGKHLSGKPATLAELLEALDHADTPCEYRLDEEMLRGFAFYDVAGDKVAVRIGLSHNCELARGQLTQLGLWLEMPAALKVDLQRARDGSGGFLMKAAERRFQGAGVSFGFAKDLEPLIEAARRK